MILLGLFITIILREHKPTMVGMCLLAGHHHDIGVLQMILKHRICACFQLQFNQDVGVLIKDHDIEAITH